VPTGHAEKALWGKMRDEKPPEKKPPPLVAITQSDFRFMLSPILARRCMYMAANRAAPTPTDSSLQKSALLKLLLGSTSCNES
jgi:hypothetical protein